MSHRGTLRFLAMIISVAVWSACDSASLVEQRALDGPSHYVDEQCEWYQWGCVPYNPDSARVGFIRGEIWTIYYSRCDYSASLKQVLEFKLDEGQIKLFDGTHFPDLAGDYHGVGEITWGGQVHLNDKLASDDYLRWLIHEGRHALGETHGDGQLFPDEEQVVSACSGP